MLEEIYRTIKQYKDLEEEGIRTSLTPEEEIYMEHVDFLLQELEKLQLELKTTNDMLKMSESVHEKLQQENERYKKGLKLISNYKYGTTIHYVQELRLIADEALKAGNEIEIDGHKLIKQNTMYGDLWFCDCKEFNIPKPITPNFCKHTEKAYAIDRENKQPPSK